ncbi:MAG: hypothetical protein KJ065_26925 [Anaerolineae bacterium]|nr:hypothetical protein [Anaerolineae bacterium]MCL4251816.1 hypothetical protein [Anaerolineae bacterium]
MIRALCSVLLRILPYQRIPPLPRGLLSARFDVLDDDSRRVLARLGARDPRGVRLVMRRHGAKTVNELVQILEHHRPRREFRRRWNAWINHLQGSTNYHPHRRAIMHATRRAQEERRPANLEIKRRLKTVVKEMSHDGG